MLALRWPYHPVSQLKIEAIYPPVKGRGALPVRRFLLLRKCPMIPVETTL